MAKAIKYFGSGKTSCLHFMESLLEADETTYNKFLFDNFPGMIRKIFESERICIMSQVDNKYLGSRHKRDDVSNWATWVTGASSDLARNTVLTNDKWKRFYLKA